VLSLDRLQMSLDAARNDVVDASTRLVDAQKVLRALNKDVARRSARAARAPLLSDRLTLEAVAGRLAIRRDAQVARVAERQRALTSAQQELDQAQQQSASSSFTPATSQLFGSPSYSQGYVFPVGGGPGVVSASHTHHDYPAVDIAAPMGSPLYALADSVVLRSWSTDASTCGIGMTLQAFDGQVWTYCHLSVLDANVVPDAQLKAGDPVGLVGQTGDATGPHLHLQLQPATAWPQQEPWFQSFAGTAFTWSDTGASEGPVVQRTLAVVPTLTPVARTLAMAADTQPAPDLALGGGPVFEAAPAATPQASTGGVVYFSSSRS
jgi:murein DD-endopeptidase MepM/ murein hydrolase activator NlpD